MQFDFDIGPATGGSLDAGGVLIDLGDRASDMRPAFKLIKPIVQEGHRKQLQTQGGYLGTPFPANAPGTLARKSRLGQGSTPMIATGATENALAGGKGRYNRIGKTSMAIGVGRDLHHVKYQLKPRRENVPARPLLGVNFAQRKLIVDIMRRHLIGVAV